MLHFCEPRDLQRSPDRVSAPPPSPPPSVPSIVYGAVNGPRGPSSTPVPGQHCLTGRAAESPGLTVPGVLAGYPGSSAHMYTDRPDSGLPSRPPPASCDSTLGEGEGEGLGAGRRAAAVLLSFCGAALHCWEQATADSWPHEVV